jgi:hypothetical protein
MRSARTESRVISTRLGFGAATAKEKLSTTRLTLARTVRIMPVSVKAASTLIKTVKIPALVSWVSYVGFGANRSLEWSRNYAYNRCACYSGSPLSGYDHHPSLARTTARTPDPNFCSDLIIQKTSSLGVPAGFVRRGCERFCVLPAGAQRCVSIPKDDHFGY